MTKIHVVLNPSDSIADRITNINWANVERELDTQGCAVLPGVMDVQECHASALLYDTNSCFRSRVVMAQHGFGTGEYKYFAYPLPPLVTQLRTTLYPHLAFLANRWGAMLGVSETYPETLDSYLKRCHAIGQTRPTPLMLKYSEGDYNCLHQDLYGELVFPLQVTILLSDPSKDFTGGEFALTEQRPRMQSRVEVVPLKQGDGVVFPVHHRPVKGVRGVYRATMRHGVSRVRSGQRFTLGIIFHDAK